MGLSGGLNGGSLSNPTNGPQGLWPKFMGSMALMGKLRQRGNREPLALWEDHVVLQQHSQRHSDVTLGSPARRVSATVRPQNTEVGKRGLQTSARCPGQDFGK